MKYFPSQLANHTSSISPPQLLMLVSNFTGNLLGTRLIDDADTTYSWTKEMVRRLNPATADQLLEGRVFCVKLVIKTGSISVSVILTVAVCGNPSEALFVTGHSPFVIHQPSRSRISIRVT